MQGYLVKNMNDPDAGGWTIIEADCAHNAAEQHVIKSYEPRPGDETTSYRIAVIGTVLGAPVVYGVKIVWHMEIVSEGEQDPNAGRGLPAQGGD